MKTENKKYLKMIYKLLLVVLGNATYALAVKLFILPNDLMTGGTTGIALVINHYFNGVSISAFVLGFNILMLLVGLALLGKKFAFSTIVSSIAYPLALELFDRLFGNVVLTEDMLLNTIFAGLGIGVGLGIVIRNGASTGGMDIPPLVLNRYFKIPVSVSLYVFDMCILLGQAVYNPLEGILYGILLILVYSVVLDKLMLMGTTRTEVKVVSGHAEEIRKVILSEVDRGVTLLYGESGYLQQDTQVILSIVSNRELPQVEKLIHSIDPESFMIISRVSEVRGRGFSMSKEYK
uniref:YitT family protein n=1 Tax=Roseburia sp. TaxID=2049040 RepID=UPI003FEDC2D4